MNALIINDLFKGNQLVELQSWLDLETPYEQKNNWQSSPDGTHMIKMCEELNTFHKVLTDKSREVFQVHNLLPTFSTIDWVEPNVTINSHRDSGPVQYTILYNYFSDYKLELKYKDDLLNLEQGQAVAYEGSQFEHEVNANKGVSVRLYFNFATPDNYYFILGNHTINGFEFPSGRLEQEVDINWL